MSFTIKAIIGNLASGFWFLPPLAKLLHELRGVRFANRQSVFISRGVILDNRYPEQIFIGDDVWLTQGVAVLSHSFSSRLQQQKLNVQEKIGPVRIGHGAFIGMHSIILPGVEIGEGCYIGAGSIVTRSIPAGMFAAGNPCRVIRPLARQAGPQLESE